MDAFITGVVAGYGIAIPVGAIAILIMEAGIRRGFRPAFFAGAGAATADFLYAALAVVGGAALAGRRLRPAWRTAVTALGNLVIPGFALFILFG